MARRRNRKRKGSMQLKLKKDSLRGILAVVFLGLSALLSLSFFGQVIANNLFQDVLNRYFGSGTIFISAILFTFGLFLTRLKWRIGRANVWLGLLLFLFSFLGFVQLFAPPSTGSETSSEGGGIIGAQLTDALVRLLSPIGAGVVLLCLLLIALLVIFNASLDQSIAVLVTATDKTVGFLKNLVSAGLAKSNSKKPALVVNGGGKAGEHQPLTDKTNLAKEMEVIEPNKREIKTEITTQSRQDTAFVNLPVSESVWEYPPLSLLSDNPPTEANRGDVKVNAQRIEKTLDSFGIRARVVEVNCGPAVTQYALELTEGTKISKITALGNDLALALAAPTGTVRIEAPIPGRSLVGIEVPNYSPSLVNLKSVLASDLMRNSKSVLTVALGHDVAGQPVISNLAKMPHVLIAGATGSGKTVLLNTFISTLLFRASPYEIKLILVDPKRVELIQYNGIPHLLTPVIVEAEKVLSALKWAIAEMERRYHLFETGAVRNIDEYNEMSGFQALPFIVVIVDELADLMAYAPTEVEGTICRLAQMSRATGIHLVLATQRPSVDVITGLIKANIPARIAFNVTSQVDSRVIIDQPGAEKLLGRGDMLYLPPDAAKPVRIQGVYVSDPEIKNVISFLKKSQVEPDYHEEVTTYAYQKLETTSGEEDELFTEAIKVVCSHDRASASLLQRRLSIGYARAARILDQLEARGIVSPAEGAKPRDVLIKSADEYFGKEVG
ncbi:DNA translocase FtsK [candidate division WWE3 bacterium CG_4_8_14_3_um_filter_42_11]|uniref:DNA translocase FtsK n=1 Tax=candidate division WWE3 bacterium CG_4_8_14_3_um_filter_42_11 TaxID=1975076 RepID=A0A2M8G6G4_UNCKA|nr:MAG: DNA translocase FtsK [candidate division WWE3 bacterium CG_4_8_14_3_um_filter_42_11]